jgi:acetolactate synthase-1/2/3 large subunit
MLPRRARGTLQCLNKARRFSTSTPVAAVTPIRTTIQPTQSKVSTETSKRTKSTAATAKAERPVPSPAFNRDDTRRSEVQPLRPYKPQELDHSFVGMTGGEIFHEMMLRQEVKHICMRLVWHNFALAYTDVQFSRLPRRCHSTRL